MTMWSIGFKSSVRKASANSARCDAVSMVEPDFEPTTTTVSRRSPASA